MRAPPLNKYVCVLCVCRSEPGVVERASRGTTFGSRQGLCVCVCVCVAHLVVVEGGVVGRARVRHLDSGDL